MQVQYFFGPHADDCTGLFSVSCIVRGIEKYTASQEQTTYLLLLSTIDLTHLDLNVFLYSSIVFRPDSNLLPHFSAIFVHHLSLVSLHVVSSTNLYSLQRIGLILVSSYQKEIPSIRIISRMIRGYQS